MTAVYQEIQLIILMHTGIMESSLPDHEKDNMKI